MAEICIKIPNELKQEVNDFGIDFSLLVRRLLKQEMQKLTGFKSIVSKSEFSEEDVKELSEKVDISLSKRFEQSLK